ncbi:MAG: hypothetical protein Q3959_03485 [Limosilactobacillus sp.]|uniref:hypothetical protein n=1 Tax=Limosilactobacillus sp. TaxID=2773925 RepID=UPI0026FF21A5|nr:hypothetical protein [Limosilactobacillus sp.]
MYKLVEIIPYEVTRDLVLEGDKRITVFDDTDVRGGDAFAFVKVGEQYDCKIGVLGDLDPAGSRFKVAGTAQLGCYQVTRIVDEDGCEFYLEPVGEAVDGDEVWIKVERYDLLQVNDVVHPGYM